MFPEPLDPVLFGVLSAAVEEESVAAYEAGFADGLRSAAYLSPEDAYDLGPPLDGGELEVPAVEGAAASFREPTARAGENEGWGFPGRPQ